MERDFYLYDVDTVVIMSEPNEEEKLKDVWTPAMKYEINKMGTITYRQDYNGRPLYLVEFDDDDWWCEEHWLTDANYMPATVSDEDASDIDGFMEEW